MALPSSGIRPSELGRSAVSAWSLAISATKLHAFTREMRESGVREELVYS